MLNKLRQLDTGQGHFDWNRGNLYPGGKRLSRPGRATKKNRMGCL